MKLCVLNQGKTKWFISDSIVRTLRLCYDFELACKAFFTVAMGIDFMGQVETLQQNMVFQAKEHLKKFLKCFHVRQSGVVDADNCSHQVLAIMLDSRYKLLAEIKKFFQVIQTKPNCFTTSMTPSCCSRL